MLVGTRWRDRKKDFGNNDDLVRRTIKEILEERRKREEISTKTAERPENYWAKKVGLIKEEWHRSHVFDGEKVKLGAFTKSDYIRNCLKSKAIIDKYKPKDILQKD